MPTKLNYSFDELMAERYFTKRVTRAKNMYHGGLDADGKWIPPRSLHRIDAINAWTGRLTDEGHPSKVLFLEDLPDTFFPNAPQAKHLLRNGATGAMSGILTLIGVVEGFGNVGLKMFPRDPLQPMFIEDLDGTCMAHLDPLFAAHGHDEAGSDYKGFHECGHDEMWYNIRDAALDNPPVPDDVFKGIPFSPPPGYAGQATPSGDAKNKNAFAGPLAEGIPPSLDMLVQAMMSLLAIELIAYTTFNWASDVLSDSTCSKDPEFAARSVGYIADDETIHVSYLQCALSEMRCRTVIGENGQKLSGQIIIDEAVERARANQSGLRIDRVMKYRMKEIEQELAAHADGDKLLEEFRALGPMPEMAA